jgi:mannose-1-phosphate guanylyltransferase/phosphomannomutase
MGQRPVIKTKAMVLAAGAGTRLQPITHEVPKPMAPVVNRPVLHHVLDTLARHKIRDVVMNVHAQPELVRAYCGDGSKWGLNIVYSHERKLLGTAGSLKKVAKHFTDSRILILSGDGHHDVNLTAFQRFHAARRSFATMVTKRVDARFEYGVALANKRGRINGFLEKPYLGSFFSNQANTGIYLFEPGVLRLLPRGFYDYGHDLWPKLLRLKKPIYSWEWKGYWCDIGNLTEYRRSSRDTLDGKIGVQIPGKQRRKGVWVEKGAQIHPKARIKAPCVIGAGAKISSGATVGPYSVVGAGSQIKAGAQVKNSILFDDANVGRNAFLANCVVGSRCRIESGSTLYNADVLKSRN